MFLHVEQDVKYMSQWGQSTLPPKKGCLQKKIAVAANSYPGLIKKI